MQWLIDMTFRRATRCFLAGILACLLIVTIPVGLASFRMAAYVLWPFGRSVVKKPGAGAGSAIMNAMDRLREANIENIGLIAERKIGRAGGGQ